MARITAAIERSQADDASGLNAVRACAPALVDDGYGRWIRSNIDRVDALIDER